MPDPKELFAACEIPIHLSSPFQPICLHFSKLETLGKSKISQNSAIIKSAVTLRLNFFFPPKQVGGGRQERIGRCGNKKQKIQENFKKWYIYH